MRLIEEEQMPCAPILSSAQAEREEFDIFWSDTAPGPERLLRLRPYQRMNHFIGMSVLARKNNLGKTLNSMLKKFPEQFTAIYPNTWLLPENAPEFKQYLQAICSDDSSTPKANKPVFIVKPEASCQGRGIFITVDPIKDIHLHEHCVVQQYVSKPCLIDGLKFDLRIYVLVLGVDPLRILLY